MSRAVATAPVRVCDVGGWTDTWFAGHGAVCSVAARPGARCTATLIPRSEGGPPVRVQPVGVAAGYDLRPDPAAGWRRPCPGPLPLVEQAVGRLLTAHPIDPDTTLIVEVEGSVPAGTSVGTSAAVTVATVAALAGLAGEPVDRETAARTAHVIEVEDVGRQAGVQDHWSAAFGGVSWIEVTAFPHLTHRLLTVPAATATDLAERLVTVAYGDGHDSSAVHEQVIARLGAPGADHAPLDRLRGLAADARAALENGDLDGWGEVLVASTAQQRALHPGLVDPAVDAVIDVARRLRARGWKVNGAGGTGGSVTILADRDPAPLRRALGRLRGIEPLAVTAIGEGLTVTVEG